MISFNSTSISIVQLAKHWIWPQDSSHYFFKSRITYLHTNWASSVACDTSLEHWHHKRISVNLHVITCRCLYACWQEAKCNNTHIRYQTNRDDKKEVIWNWMIRTTDVLNRREEDALFFSTSVVYFGWVMQSNYLSFVLLHVQNNEAGREPENISRMKEFKWLCCYT